MNALAARVLIAMSILIVVVLGILPWGQGDALSFLFPAAVFMVIHFWHFRHVTRLSPLVIAVIGHAIDVFTGGPLGFWSFVLLIGMAMTRLMARLLPTPSFLTQWISFSISCLAVSLAAWTLASVYFVQVVDWRPMAIALVVQLAAYPLVSVGLTPLERMLRAPRVPNFERGN